MSQTGSRQRRRIATYRKGQRDLAAELLQQARRVRNYSNPNEVFEAVPISIIAAVIAASPLSKEHEHG